MLSDFGLGQHIVASRHGAESAFLGTVLSVQVLRGALLALLVACAAVPIAVLYGQPELKPLLLAAALLPLVAGFTSPAIYTRTRAVRLRGVMLLGFFADFAGAIFAIAFALVHPSVWALLAGNLCSALLLTGGAALLEPGRNRFAWRRDFLRAILRFGAGMLVSSATSLLAVQGETLILGKFVPLATLGVIGIALMLTNTLVDLLSRVTGSVMFPLVAEALRENPARVHRLLALVSGYGLAAATVIAIAATLAAEELVKLLLDPRYAEAGWMFEILAVRVVLSVTQAPIWCLLLAQGHTLYAAIANTLRFAVTLAGIVIGSLYFDLTFICWVLALADLPGYAAKLAGIRWHFRPAFPLQLAIATATGAVVALTAWLR
jgi:O-antigen/teichoic acid export membrane protein